MKFFVSSLIRGMETERDAAVEAIEGLGHQAIRAEDFEASPGSPQTACLGAVRQCDGLVIIASAKYGQKQQSGKSATHEEYDAASGSKAVFVFVDANASFEPEQRQFVGQLQDWKSGRFTSKYAAPAELKKAVSTAIHRWELAQASGSFDPIEATARAIGFLPPDRRGYSSGRTTLALALAPGPLQPVIRPADLEAPDLHRKLVQMVLFGDSPIFTTAKGTETTIDNHTVWLRQEHAEFALDEQGSMLVVRELTEGSGTGMLAVIQEDVETLLSSSIEFAAAVLDHIDDTHRLTQVALAANLYDAGYRGWRTRAEHAAQPSSGTMNMIHGESTPITLKPAHRAHGALKREAQTVAQDLAVLLRRNWTRR